MPDIDQFHETFKASFADLMALFSQPPDLNFEASPRSNIDYAFPRIRPRERGAPANLRGELSAFYDGATRKHFYQDFFYSKHCDSLVWPNETLHRSKGGRYSVEKIEEKDVVNSSREASIRWFNADIIDSISRARQPTCAFLLGLPGSGKSTLLKFLVNATREHAQDKKIVFSRFESIKFFKFVRSRVLRGQRDTSLKISTVDLPESMSETVEMLSDYLFSIVLRDLLLSAEYRISNGLKPSPTCKFIGRRSSIEDLVYRAAEGTPGVTEEICQQAFHILLDSLSERRFDHKRLFSIDFRLRVALVRTLAKGLKVCLIFDGLDFLAPEDEELDAEKFTFLKIIMQMFGLGSVGQGVAIDPEFDHNALIILRNNTFYRLMDRIDTEIKAQLDRVHEIGTLPAPVVFYRAIKRGLLELESYRLLNEAELTEVADNLFRGLDLILRSLDIKFGIGRTSYEVLDLFNGNFRDCFEFIGRLLYWVSQECRDMAHFDAEPKLAEIIEFISTPRSRRIFRQRGYRIIELLLFFKTTTFQNAISVDFVNVGGASRKFLNPVKLDKNLSCTSLVDNVFDYHSNERVNKNDKHELLAKVRILQICGETDRTAYSVILEGLHRLGYGTQVTDEVDRCITILRYVGFLNRVDEGGEKFYTITPKGRFVIDHLLFNNNYLEHVYHKTKLPVCLIPTQYDAPRAEGREAWTVASIRNYFILLTYIRFVEEEKPNGALVPESWRISAAIKQVVIEAITRIVIQDYLVKRDDSPTTWFVNTALEAIHERIGCWRDERIILQADRVRV